MESRIGIAVRNILDDLDKAGSGVDDTVLALRTWIDGRKAANVGQRHVCRVERF